MKYVKEFKLFIDNDCNVYSTDRNGRIYALPLWKGGAKKGYWRVSYYPVDENWNRLPHGKTQKRAYHHDIVNTVHHGEPGDGLSTDHIDRNGFNNNPDNLRWATRKEQQANRAVSEQCKLKYGVRVCEDKRAYARALYASNPQFRERAKANAKKWKAAHPGYDREYRLKRRQVA